MVTKAPIRADMRDPRNERFFARVWERFFDSLPGEIEDVSNETTESGVAMANYFADQLKQLVESIPPAADYLHRIEELENKLSIQNISYLNRIEALEQQISVQSRLLGQIEDLQTIIESTPPPLTDTGLFFKLFGRPGGQIAHGGTISGDDLELHSNRFKNGLIKLGDNSYYDENNDLLTITNEVSAYGGRDLLRYSLMIRN